MISFDNLPGNASLKASLQRALSGRFPQTVLLSGDDTPGLQTLSTVLAAGILCESAGDGHALLVGVGVNLGQTRAFFDAQDLPHATSLACHGVAVDTAADPEWLAQYMTDFGFDRELYTYEVEGFAPYRERYKARCVNLGRRVTYDGGAGTAVDVDEEGRLIVEGENGETRVFTGEVSVQGIYGAV